MKYILFISIVLLIVSVSLLISCKHKIQTNNVNYSETIDSVRRLFIPDIRTTAFLSQKIENEVYIIESNEAAKLDSIATKLKEVAPNLNFLVNYLPEKALGENIYGLINNSVANMRSAPKHQAELISQALLGTPIKIFKKLNGWYFVQTPDYYFGWIDEQALKILSKENFNKWIENEKVIVTVNNTFVKSAGNSPVADVVLGNILEIKNIEPQKTLVSFPDGREGYLQNSEIQNYTEWIQQDTINTELLKNTALTFLGAPYLWGGASTKATDCSGFTKSIFFSNALILQRDASQQTLYGELIEAEENYSNLNIGDLLFFGEKATEAQKERVTHVGMYIGEGLFIHASGKVRISSLLPQDERFDNDYVSKLIRIRRLTEYEGKSGIEKVSESNFFSLQ